MTFPIGVDYYPEHWQTSQWKDYASLMQSAGFNVVRLAEFAWALMEPQEGRFDFEWLDDAIETLSSRGISVILGTPTATMPAWVKQKYPDVMSSVDGRHRDQWGVRKNNCFTSGTYRLLSERITMAMAKHYGTSPALIGWQTDNEIDGPHCRCHSCEAEFRVYLAEKYGNIAALNDAWGTRFWSQCYSAWDEINSPAKLHEDNPSLCLDWLRFQTAVQVRFQRDQVAILREHSPGKFITHNYMGASNWSDCFELAVDMDFASFDNYPDVTSGDTRAASLHCAFACDLTRGLKGRNFWIMETTAGPTGWGEFSRNVRPGEMRKNFYQHVAHGADAQIFFRWRTCTSGREQYWHGLLGHDGKTGRRYHEASDIAHEIHRVDSLLLGTTPTPQVALIYDYDSRWATEIQSSFKGNNYNESVRRYYDALRSLGIDVDVVPLSKDLGAYKVVLAPQLHVLADADAERLNCFVQNGGVLLADCRTGVKTPTNLCHHRTLPGLLSKSLGIEIDEYEAVVGDYKLNGSASLAGDFTGHLYADWIRPTSADALATYSDWHVADYAAVTRNQYGTGTGFYVGTIAKEEGFYAALISDVLRCAGINALISPPSGVEVSTRSGESHDLVFALNHTEQPVTVPLNFGATDILTGNVYTDSFPLERYGVAVFKIER